MKIKGRGPAKRHVSRTHMDPEIQTGYIDTNSQTCWPKDVMSGTIFFICSTLIISALFGALRVFSLTSCSKTMAKKDAGTEGRRRNCGKIETYSNGFVFSCSGKQDEKKIETWRSAEFSSETERCTLWRVDGWQRAEKNEVLWEFSESESWRVHKNEVTHKPVAYKNSAEKLAASSISENSGNPSGTPKAERRKWPQSFCTSEVLSYIDKGYSIVRRLTIEDLRMKWRTSTWTRLFGEWKRTPLFKHQFILVKTMMRIYDAWRIISWVLWRNFSKKLKSWSRTRRRSLVYLWLITKSTHEARRACCVTEIIRSRTPRLTSSPARCSVWEV